MEKPRLFIGSSKEGIGVCNQVAELLKDIAEIDLWTRVFPYMRATLERLESLSTSYDFAIMIFSPDDIRTSRQVTSSIPRDNVMFELGLFMGSIGRLRTLALTEEGVSVPSDLHGIMLPKYSDALFKTDPKYALQLPCEKIQEHIQELGPRPRLLRPVDCGIKIKSPVANAYVRTSEFSVDGLYSRLPEDHILWIFSIDASAVPKKYYPQEQVKLEGVNKWSSIVRPGKLIEGQVNRRTIGVFLVGLNGQALVSCYKNSGRVAKDDTEAVWKPLVMLTDDIQPCDEIVVNLSSF